MFTCSICSEPSRDICIDCTKDACHNHRCARCKCCSDCCACDVPLSAAEREVEPELPLPAEVIPATEPAPEPEPTAVHFEPELQPE